MSKRVSRQVMSFIRHNKIKAVNCQSIENAINKLGYTIIEFNNVYNDKNVSDLIDALKLDPYVKYGNGFTYSDKNYRLVFVHEGLSDEERLIVLAHEAGHIVLKHNTPISIIGDDILEEYEANEFAHYLLNYSKKGLINYLFSFRSMAAAASLIIITVAITLLSQSLLNTAEFGDYYVTDSGECYHEKECIFVKNKNNVRKLTLEEFEDKTYSPCKVCLP